MSILCPIHHSILIADSTTSQYVCASGCIFPATAVGVADLMAGATTADQTAEHYSLQWGSEIDFASFYAKQPEALSAMTSKQMGWPVLVERIRTRARSEPVQLLDAACGYGGLFADLFASPAPGGLKYLGADIHSALQTIQRPKGAGPEQAEFVRWDISNPIPTDELFDFIICRAAIHHTPDPRTTFRSLVSRLAPDGVIAITVYAKKAPMREACDDALRAKIVPMTPRAALSLARQFTVLGSDLRSCDGRIEITQDLPFLGIKAGSYSVQEFLYDHFLKCWYNPGFGEQYSDIVNFDWYHPPYAYRYDQREVLEWFEDHGIEILATATTKAQHYFEGRLRS